MTTIFDILRATSGGRDERPRQGHLFGKMQTGPMTGQVSRSDARPSVLFVAAISPNKIGGIEIFAAELARQLDRECWDLTMCFQGPPPPLVEDFLLAPGNVTLAVMREQLGLGFSNLREFTRLLRRDRPCVLVYTLGGVVRWWPLLGRLMGVRRSVYYDQTSRTARSYDYRASRQVQVVMKALSESVCATKFVKACSDREGIIPPEKSRVIYSAVDNTRALGSADAFRERYGIQAGRIVVLQISWLVPEKGIDMALRAAKRVLEVRQDFQFVFCGDGANRAEYEALAEELGIAGHVTWTGQIEDLAGSGVFRAAEIQIQCSQWHEAFCLAVAEGMSAGLPIVASRIGGLPELVEDGVNGILFDPKSDAELAEAILTLGADEEIRRQMGAVGRKRAIETHDLIKNVGLWVDVLLDRERSRRV
jgi:glycosyltransferase involved in cell wall biosynthesis